jgi:hypothetical protein
MRLDKFKVSFYKKDLLYFMTFFIITLIACFCLLFDEKYRGIAIFGLVFTVGAILYFVSNLLFKLEVENTCFKIRTRLGMQREFNLSEIEIIFCTKRPRMNIKNNFYIKLYANGHFYEVNNQMEGFDTLAEYFIQMYINDELYENAINKETIEQLKFFASKNYK